MELIVWGIAALGGLAIVYMVRVNLEEKRLAKERDAFKKRILLARINIHKEIHGQFPTAQDMVRIYSDIKDL